MTMTNQGDEAVRLVPGEASKKSGLPGEASMRTPLTGSSSFQLSSRSAGSSYSTAVVAAAASAAAAVRLARRGVEEVRLARRGVDAHAAHRLVLVRTVVAQRRKLVERCSLRSTGLAARRLTSHLRPPSLANAAPACWPRSTELDAAKRMRCPSRPRARLSASSATSKSTALGAHTLGWSRVYSWTVEIDC